MKDTIDEKLLKKIHEKMGIPVVVDNMIPPCYCESINSISVGILKEWLSHFNDNDMIFISTNEESYFLAGFALLDPSVERPVIKVTPETLKQWKKG